MKVQIMSPAADRVDFKVPPAPRLATFEGKTIGLYNNMTGGADVAVGPLRRAVAAPVSGRQVPALRRGPARGSSSTQPGRPH